jgi:hypothetical protein
MYENEINVVLKFYETQRWQQTFWNNTRLHINPETAHQTIISCIQITELKKILELPYQLQYKCENQVEKMVCTSAKVLKQKYSLYKLIQM